MNSSYVLYYYYSMYFICLSCSNKVLQATKYDGTIYDLDLKVKVKFDITDEFLRCGFLLIFNTFYMSNLFR